jgi:hypothetical protein
MDIKVTDHDIIIIMNNELLVPLQGADGALPGLWLGAGTGNESAAEGKRPLGSDAWWDEGVQNRIFWRIIARDMDSRVSDWDGRKQHGSSTSIPSTGSPVHRNAQKYVACCRTRPSGFRAFTISAERHGTCD